MPPKDRRIIHQFFSEDEDIETKSHGDGYYKRIKLVPSNLEKRPPRQKRDEQPENDNHASDSQNDEHQAIGNVSTENHVEEEVSGNVAIESQDEKSE